MMLSVSRPDAMENRGTVMYTLRNKRATACLSVCLHVCVCVCVCVCVLKGKERSKESVTFHFLNPVVSY